MDGTVLKMMEAQLTKWRLHIARLAGAVHGVGNENDFDALVYIDELKLLHAIARSKLHEFKAAGSAERSVLEAGLNVAWSDLELALENLGP
jgi:hypothetical protein